MVIKYLVTEQATSTRKMRTLVLLETEYYHGKGNGKERERTGNTNTIKR